MLRGNLVGFAMIVVSALAVVIGKYVLNLDDATTMIIVGTVLIILDLILRLRSYGRAGWLTQRQFGGNIYFVPIWAVGIVVIVANVVNTFVS